MSFDPISLSAAIAAHGPVARIVIAGISGSSPREPGATMLVWREGSAGTIGGGALEWQAMAAARALLAGAPDDGAATPALRAADAPYARVDRIPLGPTLGQCCGGAVTLVTELWDAARLSALPEGAAIARPLDGRPMPLALHRLLTRARAEGAEVPTRLIDGWLVEPLARPMRRLWIWGAGHVGRALVGVIAPLPGFALTWVDTAADRFPADGPAAERLIASNPADLVAAAPVDAEHLILTYSHALDLELCHRLLGHGFGACGLIGSATKWARFRSRLASLGHTDAQIARIRCPIGEPSLGKHPQAIAVGVAAQLLRREGAQQSAKDRAG